MAKAANKPFYVAVESYKFVRYFPLSQYDLPSGVSSTLNLVFNEGESLHDPIPEKVEVYKFLVFNGPFCHPFLILFSIFL